MKETLWFTIVWKDRPESEVRALALRAGVEPEYKVTRMIRNSDIRLAKDDPRAVRLTSELEASSFRWSVRREIKYSEADLAAAELLSLTACCAGRGNTGPTYGTEYDRTDACPQCGTGARQVSPLRLLRSDFRGRTDVAQTYRNNILLSERLATELKIDFRGPDWLVQVQERKTCKPLPWWQILPTISLPPLDVATSGMEPGKQQCPACRREGFYDGTGKPFEPVYKLPQRLNEQLPAVVSTWECFGLSTREGHPAGDIGFATPRLVVRNSVWQSLVRLKVRQLSFTPVTLSLC